MKTQPFTFEKYPRLCCGRFFWRTVYIVTLSPIWRCLTFNWSHALNVFGQHSSTSAPHHMGLVKRIWYLSPMRAAKVQVSLRIRAVSPEPPLLAHTSSESGGTFRQKARSLAPLNGWACAVKICNDGMLEDTNSLDGAHVINLVYQHYHNFA